MSLLEVQVADMREDITEVEEDVIGLVEDVNFLFDEQIIQDQRLLNLETTSTQVIVELAEINENVEGWMSSIFFVTFCVSVSCMVYFQQV